MQKNLSSYQMFKDENNITYLNNRILNLVQLQILDLEANIRYIQKKGAMSYLKESLSQIYKIFDQTQPLFRDTNALFLHETVKKLMNLFGIICFTLMEQMKQTAKDINNGEGCPTPKINDLNNKNKQGKQKENNYKPTEKHIQMEESYPKNTINKLGGIHLYNESYSRHTSNNGVRPLKKNPKYQTSKQELTRQVLNQLNTSPFDTPRPDQILDYFNFKFKYGCDDPIITFHEELQSISNFFIESKNEALQFLNQTENQNTLISYDETSFRSTMSLINAQKEDKVKKFTQKIQSFLQTIKHKSQDNTKIFEKKFNELEQQRIQTKPPCICAQKQTQTDFHTEQQFRQKFITSVEQYEIMLGLKERELKQIFSKRLELQNQLSMKNREIVFLKLNREEKELLIQSLHKKLKFLKNSRISIDKFNFPRHTFDSARNQTIHKQPVIQEEIKPPSEEASYEQIRKQKKIAKIKMIQGRRGSLNVNKPLFPKRLTQAEIIIKSISREDQQQWNLSQITQKYRQESNFDDNESQISSSTNNIKKSIKNREQNFSNSLSKYSSRQSNRSKQSLADYKERGSLKNPSLVGSIRNGSFSSKKNLNIQTSPTSPIPSRYSANIYEQQDRQKLLNSLSEQISQIPVTNLGKKTKQNFRHSETIKKSFFAKQRKNSERNAPQIQFGYNDQKDFAQRISQQNQERTQTFIQQNHQTSSHNSLLKQIGKKLNKQTSVIKKNSVSKQKQTIKNQPWAQYSQSVPTTPGKEIIKQDLATSFKQRTIFSSHQYNLTIHPCQHTITAITPAANESTDKQTQLKGERLYQNSISNLSKTNKQKYRSFGKVNSFIHRSGGNSTRFSSKKNNSIHMQNNRSQLNLRSIKNSLHRPNQSQDYIHQADRVTIQKREEQLVIPGDHSTQMKGQSRDHKQPEIAAQFHSFKFSLTDKQNTNQLFEKLKDKQALLQAEEREANSLAMNCQTLQQFKNKIGKIHAKQCGHNCTHLQKLVNHYLKLRQNSKQKLCLPISNIHESIEHQQFPTLRRKKH